MKALSFLFAAIFAMFSAAANAALDPGIQTAATTVSTDAATLGGIVLLVIVGIALFKHLRAAK